MSKKLLEDPKVAELVAKSESKAGKAVVKIAADIFKSACNEALDQIDDADTKKSVKEIFKTATSTLKEAA